MHAGRLCVGYQRARALCQEEDTDVVTIVYGQSTWFIHCNTVNPASIVDRAVIVTKDFDAFTAQLDAKLAEVRCRSGSNAVLCVSTCVIMFVCYDVIALQANALRAVHYADGHWVAYFEGMVTKACTWSTCETVEALAAELQEQLDNGMSLKYVNAPRVNIMA